MWRSRIARGVVCAMGLGLAAGWMTVASSAGPWAKKTPTVFVAPGGSDQAACTRSHPCRSLDRGLRAAAPGAVVELAGGQYPPQILQPTRRVRHEPVVFRPAPEAEVRIDRALTVRASNVELRRLTVNGQVDVENQNHRVEGASNVTLRRLNAKVLFVAGRVSDIRILGGSYGPAVDAHPQVKSYNLGESFGPRRVLIDGVRFHDFTRSGSAVHTECLQVYDSSDVVIRRSRFTNCDGTAGIAVGKIGRPPASNILIENNWFDKRGDSYYAIGLSYNVRNLTLRYNSASKAIAFLNRPIHCTMPSCGPYTFVGNYMPAGYNWCTSVARYSHNVWKGAKCAPTDRSVSRMEFVDEGRFDLHLAPTSTAICRGDPADAPRRDIDGRLRPRRFRPDAGADHAGRTARPRSRIARCRRR
jgi:hypothetical protein